MTFKIKNQNNSIKTQWFWYNLRYFWYTAMKKSCKFEGMSWLKKINVNVLNFYVLVKNKISQNKHKLFELDRNLWIFLLKVTLIFNLEFWQVYSAGKSAFPCWKKGLWCGCSGSLQLLVVSEIVLPYITRPKRVMRCTFL